MRIWDADAVAIAAGRIEVEEPPDFDSLWRMTVEDSRTHGWQPIVSEIDAGLRTVRTYDVQLAGFNGQVVRAWLQVPIAADVESLVVEYVGYGGGRGRPSDWLLWPAFGFAHLVMDNRGQGSGWRRGQTSDEHDGSADPQAPGFLTRGVLDIHRFYYRRLVTDAVRAVDAACALQVGDPSKVAVVGASQGGGLALAAAALSGGVAAVVCHEPFLAAIRRAVELTETDPYEEIRRYCRVHKSEVEQVFRTLAYIDGVLFAKRSTAPAMFSNAMRDGVCPPECVLAAFNAYGGPKQIAHWPFNGHEGGGPEQELSGVDFLLETLGLGSDRVEQ